MPIVKLQFKPGVNRENTRYATEGGWYSADKVRFRQGTPESIGGWVRISDHTYLGICRSLKDWTSMGSVPYMALGTNLKHYIELGGKYFDVTPIRATTSGSATFAAMDGSTTITVIDNAHGAVVGDFVTYTDTTSLGGAITEVILDSEYQITSIIGVNSYTIETPIPATAADSGDGGSSTKAEYQLNVGSSIQIPITGWGAGGWGLGTWGSNTAGIAQLRLWSQSNYGGDLIFGPKGGGIYYWSAFSGTGTRGVTLSSMVGASDTPVVQSHLLVSDVSRFVLAFGTNEIGSSDMDPMLIRWSDQENPADWTPTQINQAGDIKLSRGSRIISALQTRQEIVVFTDVAVYSMQYLGPPLVWNASLLADGVSCISPNAALVTAGVTFWMGTDKFYIYDGVVRTLQCDLLAYVFGSLNMEQRYQIFAGANEAFNEVWWFYCSLDSITVDRYVIFNYIENTWTHGTLGRTAWVGAGVRAKPIAATYSNNLVAHEVGVDDVETGTLAPIHSYIESSEMGIDDGDQFVFVQRILPDITFRKSTAGSQPSADLTVRPMVNSGTGFQTPGSVALTDTAQVARIARTPIEEFTGQVFIRVRGRQFVFRLESNKIGTAWQMGAMRADIQLDGGRG